MTMNKLVGISLALVMLSGSIPLGFSEPLRVQLEQGLETNQMQCDNPNHVLVLRTNGNVACVTEKMAEKLGWEIIDSGISLVEYDFPLTAKQTENTDSQNGEPIELPDIKTELQISNFPKLGESAEISVIVTDWFLNEIIDDSIEEIVIIEIADNLRVVTGLEDFSQTVFNDYGYTRYLKEILVHANQTQIFKVNVVALGVGETWISAGQWPSSSSFNLVIGENETLLKEDYYKKYPSTLDTKLASIESAKQLALEEEILEEERLLEQGCQFIEKIGMWCPPSDEELEEMRVKDYETIGDTEEELRAYLKADGASDEEIEEIVREVYPEASTQSFSFLEPAYAATNPYAIGRLTTDSNPLSPAGLDFASTVHGAQACAFEWDSITSTLTELSCRFTGDSGRYVISNLILPSTSQDGTLDIMLTFTTDGKYAYVAPPGNNDFELSVTPYNTGFDYFGGTTDNISHNKQLSMGNVQTETGIFRAFWIVDAISDAHEWLDDEFKLDVRKQMKVGWKWNEGTRAFGYTDRNGNPRDGAFYHSSNTIETMFLNGYTGTLRSPDDAYERWTILHEYGHFVMDESYRFGAFHGGDCPTTGHQMHLESGERCAWTEGFADILPSLVDDSPRYPRDILRDYDYEEATLYSNQRDTTPNGNFATLNANGDYIGNLVEGRVAASIWDLYDSNRESGYDYMTVNQQSVLFDDRQEGYDEIKYVFDDREPITFEQFYNEWQNRYSTKDATNVMKLHYMSFVANNAPVATPKSTITINEDSSTIFWLYGTDTDNDKLTFTITNYPNDGTLSEEIGAFDQSQQYKYTPDLAFSGSDEFWFKVNDGTEDSPTIKVSITVTALTPITFTTTWDGITKIIIEFSEKITNQFSTSDFKISSGTITSVTNFVDSKTRHLIISNVPVNTAITVEYIGSGVSNLGGTEKLRNGESDVTPQSPNPDIISPTLTIPTDKTFEATAINTPLDATQIGAATAIDNIDPNPTITNNAPLTFPLGDTIITYTATDSSANSATATQTITIQDTTNPIIIAPPNITKEATDIQTPVTLIDPPYHDIFDVIITDDGTNGYLIGDTIVTFTATDANDNIATDSMTITIIDTTIPIITIPEDKIFEATRINTPLTQSDYGSANATDIFTVTITNDAPDTFPVGNTIITWNATDINGNSISAIQTITIVDNEEPFLPDMKYVKFTHNKIDNTLMTEWGFTTPHDYKCRFMMNMDVQYEDSNKNFELTYNLGNPKITDKHMTQKKDCVGSNTFSIDNLIEQIPGDPVSFTINMYFAEDTTGSKLLYPKFTHTLP